VTVDYLRSPLRPAEPRVAIAIGGGALQFVRLLRELGSELAEFLDGTKVKTLARRRAAGWIW
jgi:hypothetical protein